MISIIRAIVAALTGPPEFYHGTSQWQNLDADKAELSNGIVYLDEPLRSRDDVKQGGYMEETYPLSLLFLKKSELKWTPAEHQVVIAEMRTLRREFINALQSHASIRRIGDPITTDVTNVLDANLSGVFVEIDVTPFNTEAAC